VLASAETDTPVPQESSSKLYDEVSEEQYSKIVKGRLQRDDFVEDDGVDGYMDNGMDDWGADDDEQEDSEDEDVRRKKKCTRLLYPIVLMALTVPVFSQEEDQGRLQIQVKAQGTTSGASNPIY
jgi:hypothetical protein